MCHRGAAIMRGCHLGYRYIDTLRTKEKELTAKHVQDSPSKMFSL